MIAQDPSGREHGEASTPTVTVVVSNGAGTAIVPNVVGESKDQAKGDLKAAGLSVRIVKRTTTDPNEDGRCSTNRPAPGRGFRAASS